MLLEMYPYLGLLSFSRKYSADQPKEFQGLFSNSLTLLSRLCLKSSLRIKNPLASSYFSCLTFVRFPSSHRKICSPKCFIWSIVSLRSRATSKSSFSSADFFSTSILLIRVSLKELKV